MQNQITNLMLNQLKAKNPQMYQMISQNQNNPMDLLKNTIGNYSPEQKEKFFNQAKMMGFPDNVLQEIQKQL